MSQPNKEFSITFWININNNPGWKSDSSEINFPPFTVNNGITVFVSKVKEQLKVYILHPEIGYRKLVTKITKYLNVNTFVALTNDSEETILYLNAEKVCSLKTGDNKFQLEVNDYVMVSVKKNDIKNLSIAEDIEVVLPAKVKKIYEDKVQFEFFTIGNKVEIAELEKSKIKN